MSESEKVADAIRAYRRWMTCQDDDPQWEKIARHIHHYVATMTTDEFMQYARRTMELDAGSQGEGLGE